MKYEPLNKRKRRKRTNIPPKKNGAPMINIKCSNCGAMFSERDGHTCGNNDGYY